MIGDEPFGSFHQAECFQLQGAENPTQNAGGNMEKYFFQITVSGEGVQGWLSQELSCEGKDL